MLFPLSSLEIFSPPISLSLLLHSPPFSPCFSGSRTLLRRFARRNIFPGLREGTGERERKEVACQRAWKKKSFFRENGKTELTGARIITTRILSSSVSRFEIRAFLFFSTLLFFSSTTPPPPGTPLSSFSLFLPAMIPLDDVDEDVEERRCCTSSW